MMCFIHPQCQDGLFRNVSCEDHVISEGMTSLSSGFVNYFGMQRFGTASVPTYHIGR